MRERVDEYKGATPGETQREQQLERGRPRRLAGASRTRGGRRERAVEPAHGELNRSAAVREVGARRATQWRRVDHRRHPCRLGAELGLLERLEEGAHRLIADAQVIGVNVCVEGLHDLDINACRRDVEVDAHREGLEHLEARCDVVTNECESVVGEVGVGGGVGSGFGVKTAW